MYVRVYILYIESNYIILWRVIIVGKSKYDRDVSFVKRLYIKNPYYVILKDLILKYNKYNTNYNENHEYFLNI